VLTDEKPKVPEYRRLEKTFTIDKKYLVIPIKNGARQTELTLEVEGNEVRRYGTELATNPENNAAVEDEVRKQVDALCRQFPIYANLLS